MAAFVRYTLYLGGEGRGRSGRRRLSPRHERALECYVEGIRNPERERDAIQYDVGRYEMNRRQDWRVNEV